jgi:hypothetical protein
MNRGEREGKEEEGRTEMKKERRKERKDYIPISPFFIVLFSMDRHHKN